MIKNRVEKLEDDIIILKSKLVQIEYSNDAFNDTVRNVTIDTINQFHKQLSKVIDDNDRLIKKNEDLEKVIEMICQKDGIVILRK